MTTSIPLPDGAVIGASAPSEVLGAAPGGTVIYGGADLVTIRDAHGYLYVPYCGERPGRAFGTHCFRVTPAGVPEWVELPAFTEGRAGVSLEPDGLYLSWPTPNGRDMVRVRVPGFVVPGFPSSGQATPAPVPIPAQPPAGSVPTVDREAREYTTKVKQELEAKIRALETRIGQGGGLTAQQVADIVWSKAPDAIYARLHEGDAGLVGQVQRYARQVIPTPVPIDRTTLRLAILSVLREIFMEAGG